jgi:hypothetical protein
VLFRHRSATNGGAWQGCWRRLTASAQLRTAFIASSKTARAQLAKGFMGDGRVFVFQIPRGTGVPGGQVGAAGDLDVPGPGENQSGHASKETPRNMLLVTYALWHLNGSPEVL